MVDNFANRWEEENLVKACEEFVLKNIKRKDKSKIEQAVKNWIQKTSIKVFRVDKLIQRVYEDLKNNWNGSDNKW